MQSGLGLLLFLLSVAPERPPECDGIEDVRGRAECLHTAKGQDVAGKLFRLAVFSLQGKAFVDAFVNADFLYVAEEAGEAARGGGPESIIRLATAKDPDSVVFAARAITAYLGAVEHGYSHTLRFQNRGDKDQFAVARNKLSAPCKRLAKHPLPFVREEARRCLDTITPKPAIPDQVDFKGIGPPGGGAPLRAVPPR
jgi:hypothetical protein